MNLEVKWIYRQSTLNWLSIPFSATFGLIANIVISFCKLTAYGTKMYPLVPWPKHVDVIVVLKTFLDISVYPVLWWIPIAILVDILIIRPLVQFCIK